MHPSSAVWFQIGSRWRRQFDVAWIYTGYFMTCWKGKNGVTFYRPRRRNGWFRCYCLICFGTCFLVCGSCLLALLLLLMLNLLMSLWLFFVIDYHCCTCCYLKTINQNLWSCCLRSYDEQICNRWLELVELRRTDLQPVELQSAELCQTELQHEELQLVELRQME